VQIAVKPRSFHRIDREIDPVTPFPAASYNLCSFSHYFRHSSRLDFFDTPLRAFSSFPLVLSLSLSLSFSSSSFFLFFLYTHICTPERINREVRFIVPPSPSPLYNLFREIWSGGLRDTKTIARFAVIARSIRHCWPSSAMLYLPARRPIFSAFSAAGKNIVLDTVPSMRIASRQSSPLLFPVLFNSVCIVWITALP